METTEKLALLSGRPLKETVQHVVGFPDELQFQAKESDILSSELFGRDPASLHHHYRATGNIFQLGGSEVRPYNYIGTY